ncbi:MAG TPA: dihydroneopterin aldolase [Gaiellaceae bacterium]|nr:dihydroneopterin aldolase [Gaiellaceae bacterium]
MTTIELEGIELWGFHGLLDHERSEGQRFLFDVRLDLKDGETVARTDAIADTVDYRRVVDCVREVSAGRDFVTLEALASTLADALLAAFPVTRARVRVRKPEVELAAPVEHAAVVVERAAAG